MIWTGPLIEAAREEHGWTRAQLAELLHTTTHRIVALEAGAANPTLFSGELTRLFSQTKRSCLDCGHAGCHSCAPAKFLTEDLRYIAEDAESLSDVVQRVRDWVDERLTEGWELLQPLNDGCLHLGRDLYV